VSKKYRHLVSLPEFQAISENDIPVQFTETGTGRKLILLLQDVFFRK